MKSFYLYILSYIIGGSGRETGLPSFKWNLLKTK